MPTLNACMPCVMHGQKRSCDVCACVRTLPPIAFACSFLFVLVVKYELGSGTKRPSARWSSHSQTVYDQDPSSLHTFGRLRTYAHTTHKEEAHSGARGTQERLPRVSLSESVTSLAPLLLELSRRWSPFANCDLAPPPGPIYPRP